MTAVYIPGGHGVHQDYTGGAASVRDMPKASGYVANLTMNNTARGGAFASGAGGLLVTNEGTTGQIIYVTTGITQADANTALTIVAGAATTGRRIHPLVNIGGADVRVGRPAGHDYYAMCNATAGHTQVVSLVQV